MHKVRDKVNLPMEDPFNLPKIPASGKGSLGSRLELPAYCDICGNLRRKGNHDKCSKTRQKRMEAKRKGKHG